jgi:2-aminoadipate transaminase
MTYSKAAATLKPDEIREMIKITSQPGVINFAGGLPAPELFPAKEMIHATELALTKCPAIAMQYHATDGYLPLREKIVSRLSKIGIQVPIEQLIISSGSQQVLDLAGKLFVDHNDIVLTESPTYSGVFNAVKTYLPMFMGIPTDDDGVIPDKFEELCKTYGGRIKLIYVIPDYQNPSGRVWSMERRKAFVELVGKYQIPTLEDAPYRELSFDGNPMPPLKSMDDSGMIIHLGSFSKILAPGYRISWIAAKKDFADRFTWASQGAFLQSSTVNEVIIDQYLENYDLDAHIEDIRNLYKRHGELMLGLMKKEFPESVKWTDTKGGMFCMVTLPQGKLARDLLKLCLEQKVAFVVGDGFYSNGDVFNTFRLNFATSSDANIEEGMKRLGRAVRELLS